MSFDRINKDDIELYNNLQNEEVEQMSCLNCQHLDSFDPLICRCCEINGYKTNYTPYVKPELVYVERDKDG